MIAIICAMQIECDAILKYCTNIQKNVLFSKTFYEAELAGKKVVIGLCGVAKVNAAITTTILCAHYDIQAILNIGVAGGLKENENVMDLVISDQVVQHDYDTTALDGEAGKGIWVKADQDLLALAIKVLEPMDVTYHVGCVASGDLFVTKQHLEKILHDFPDAICAEMEAGAIAQTADSFHIPFIVLRSLSDVAVKEKSAMDFMEYVQIASQKSAEFTYRFVEGY